MSLLEAGAIGFKIHEDYGASPELIDATLRFADDRDVCREPAYRRPPRDRRARGHDRGDRWPDRPRLPRRGLRRRPRAGPHRARPRGQRDLLVDDTDDPVGRRRGRRGRPDDRAQPRRLVRRGARPRADPRARPSRDDGRRGPAPRARRDRDRQLRLAGHGPDHGDGPPDVPARPRDEGLALDRGRARPSRPAGRATPARLVPGRRQRARPALPRQGRRSSRRSPTASPTTSGRWRPDALRTSCSGSPRTSASSRSSCIKGGHPAWAPLGEGNATVEGAEPTRYAPEWAGLATTARPSVSALFVSSSADAAALRRRLDTGRELLAIAGCRGLTRSSLRAQPRDGADRGRPGRWPGHARGPAARGRAASPRSR